MSLDGKNLSEILTNCTEVDSQGVLWNSARSVLTEQPLFLLQHVFELVSFWVVQLSSGSKRDTFHSSLQKQ